jgi:prepilin-type N-terminal cleavage/methylation domain-containing protein
MVKKIFGKRKKLDNDGFTIAELLVATAIMSIVALVIYSFMTQSSRMYTKASSDADIQMEAQLVANTISDLIIDCEVNIRYQKEVSNEIASAGTPGDGSTPSSSDDIAIKGTDGSDPNDGKILEIDNMDYQFLIINSTDDKLYYVERTADSDGNYTGKFDLANSELLAENVSYFSVDTSRLKGEGNENIVSYTMTYEKNGRQYTGVYQVNLRNQVTLNQVVTKAETKNPSINRLAVDPEVVYVNIKGNNNPQAPHIELTTDKRLDFTAIYSASNLTSNDNLFEWSVDSGYGYSMSPDPCTDKSVTLVYDDSFDLDTLKGSSFRLTVTSQIDSKAGEKLSASALIKYRKVTNVAISPRTGIVNKEAPADSTVTLTGLADGWNLDSDQKYVQDWKLQYKLNDGAWSDCPSSLASITGTTSTGVQIRLGSDLTSDHRLRVSAVSTFDSEYEGSYEFGIYETPPEEYTDAPSRGVEIDLLAYAQKYPGVNGNRDIISIENPKVQNVSGWDGYSADMFEIKQDPTTGRWVIYLDYEKFKYQSKSQLIQYYQSATVDITCTYKFVQSDGNVQTDQLLKVKLDATSIAASTPAENTAIVIPYGKSTDISFSVTGYNITQKNLIGMYLDGQNLNANQYGMLDLNNYVSGEYISSLGSRTSLMQDGTVRLTSKSANPVRPDKAMTFMITIDEMYRLLQYTDNKNTGLKGNIDFKVYVSNVEGRDDLFIPGPNAGAYLQSNISSTGISCSSLEPCNVEGTIRKYTASNGSELLQLTCAGKTYYWNETYNYWQIGNSNL